jgi:hypothetical protein
MADLLNGILISEVLADNAGGGATDVNLDGTTNKQDEFIEFQNATNADIDLEGYQVWSQEHGLLHTFGTGDTILAGETATVVGTYNNPPTGFYGANGNNNSAQGNGGFLEDGEGQKNDTLYLVDPDGNYIRLSYGANLNIPTSLPAGFPTGGSLQGGGESISSGAPNGTSFIRDQDGEFIENPDDPNPGDPGVPCFTAGTLITTDQGDIAVEDLTPGMRVLSRDHGYVPLRAARAATIRKTVLRWNPSLCPVSIPAGVLGNTHTLTLSPAHRILVEGADVELVSGAAEALVPVHYFVGQAGIARLPTDRLVTYFHLLFDDHEVICSNGVWTESLFMGDLAHAAVRTVEDWKIAEGFDLASAKHSATARTVLRGFEAKVLIDCGLPCAKAAEVAA